MPGALTAADEDFDLGVGADEEEMAGGSGADPYAIDVASSGGIADLTPAYDAAIARLRQQRAGMSTKERLGALLVGFGRPTQSGKWQEAASNAAQQLLQQRLLDRERAEKRQTELDRLMGARDVAGIRSKAQIEAARIRAGAVGKGGAGGLKDADQRKRFGYAKMLFPGKTDEEYMGLLYSPKIDYMMMRPGVASSAASQGVDVSEALGSVESAIVPKEVQAATSAGPPPGMNVLQLQQEALDAVKSGKDRAMVVDRLRKWNVPLPEGL